MKKAGRRMVFMVIVSMLFAITPAFAEQMFTEINPAVDLINKMGIDMNKAGVDHSKLSPLGATSVSIGTNQSFSSADAGNCGYGGSGVGTHGEGFSISGWADSGVYLAAFGDIGSWAWVGNQINVTGSGSRSATIRFTGSYNGTIYRLTNANASARVRVSILDLTTGAELGGYAILNATANSTYSSTYNKTVTVTLQAGHSYALRHGVATAVNCSAPGTQAESSFCNTDIWGQWTPDPGNPGVTYGSISLTWN